MWHCNRRLARPPRPRAAAAADGLVVRPRLAVDGAAERQRVHRPATRRRNTIRQRLGHTAEHDIHHALACLDIPRHHRRRVFRVQHRPRPRAHVDRPEAPAVQRHALGQQAAEAVVDGRPRHRRRAVHAPRHRIRGVGQIHRRPAAGDGERATDGNISSSGPVIVQHVLEVINTVWHLGNCAGGEQFGIVHQRPPVPRDTFDAILVNHPPHRLGPHAVRRNLRLQIAPPLVGRSYRIQESRHHAARGFARTNQQRRLDPYALFINVCGKRHAPRRLPADIRMVRPIRRIPHKTLIEIDR